MRIFVSGSVTIYVGELKLEVAVKGLKRVTYICPRSGGGVHPVLSQTHERHRCYALQHELHQQQPGNADRRTLQPQRGRRHQGQKRQVQKVTSRESFISSLTESYLFL